MKFRLFFPLCLLLAPVGVFAQSSTSTDDASYGSRHQERSGVFIEPLVQAGREDTSIKTSQLPVISDDTSGTARGYGFGAKVGVHVSEAVFLGADARYSKVSFQDSSYDSASGDLYNYGPTVGLQFPHWGLRVLGTYVIGGQFNPAAGAQGIDLKFQDPRGWRTGLGFHVAAVSLNVEYEDLTYDKSDIESFGSLGPGNYNTNVDYESRGYAVSVSFPMEL